MEYAIVIVVMVVVLFIIITDIAIEKDQNLYKCFMRNVFKGNGNMSDGCSGITDDKICKKYKYNNIRWRKKK